MKTILKYQLHPIHKNHFAMPVSAEIIHVDAQHDVATLWALIDDNKDCTQIIRTFYGYSTGAPIEPDRTYVGTVLLNDGYRVVHVFEEV